MTSTSVLLILVGLFIIVNSQNFVGVFQGNKALSFQGAKNKSIPETRDSLLKEQAVRRGG